MQGFVLRGKMRDILDVLRLLARLERINPHLLGLLWGKVLNAGSAHFSTVRTAKIGGSHQQKI